MLLPTHLGYHPEAGLEPTDVAILRSRHTCHREVLKSPIARVGRVLFHGGVTESASSLYCRSSKTRLVNEVWD